MIKHIVMFKLKEFNNPTEKQAHMSAIKSALENLPAQIDIIRSIRVDFNINPDEEWDLILTSTFDTLEDVKTYATHPAHIAVGAEHIAPIRTARAAVDYTTQQ